MTPNKQRIPPHIKHQITYFRTPGWWGTENKKKRNQNQHCVKFEVISRNFQTNYYNLNETLSIKHQNKVFRSRRRRKRNELVDSFSRSKLNSICKRKCCSKTLEKVINLNEEVSRLLRDGEWVNFRLKLNYGLQWR